MNVESVSELGVIIVLEDLTFTEAEISYLESDSVKVFVEERSESA